MLASREARVLIRGVAVAVVSLLSSATEIVCAPAAGGELVGIFHECDHPPEMVVGLPALTASRLS